MDKLKRKHHYVSQSYLKAWTDDRKYLSTYRILVSHDSVPLWQKQSIKNIAYHHDLYTRVALGTDSDEFEIWMDQEIESPAQEALNKIRSNKKLTHIEWGRLIRFILLHDIRTPARFMEHMNRWQTEVPEIVKEVLNTSLKKFERPSKTEKHIETEIHPNSDMIPLRLTKITQQGSANGSLKAEVITGRSLWLFSIKHVLNNTYKKIKKQRWSVIRAPEGIEWFTSDNPVVKLNYYATRSYDFKGGWGNKGTEILFPLSPQLLLYTQVGKKKRHENISEQFARKLQSIIAEHAHQAIFATQPIEVIETLRPRKVDSNTFGYERETWEKWHADQRDAELNLKKRDEM